jgi:hypothetical protein
MLGWDDVTVANRPIVGQGLRNEQWDNGCCLVTGGKHVSNTRAIAR